MARKTIRTSVSLPEDQYAIVAQLAEQNDVSVAWVIRQAIHQYLESTENSQLALPIYSRGQNRNE